MAGVKWQQSSGNAELSACLLSAADGGMEGGGWEEVQMERDNGGEPCFFGREP